MPLPHLRERRADVLSHLCDRDPLRRVKSLDSKKANFIDRYRIFNLLSVDSGQLLAHSSNSHNQPLTIRCYQLLWRLTNECKVWGDSSNHPAGGFVQSGI
jgi:hypothetical protein